MIDENAKLTPELARKEIAYLESILREKGRLSQTHEVILTMNRNYIQSLEKKMGDEETSWLMTSGLFSSIIENFRERMDEDLIDMLDTLPSDRVGATVLEKIAVAILKERDTERGSHASA